ncbi:glycosyltransferase [Tundrisphaera lichenicola]|uniref:glycosyltransferase n=1 Tax=Tundrisphaera lichenicola TaxID=2029860 RepID=UPI003EBD279D
MTDGMAAFRERLLAWSRTPHREQAAIMANLAGGFRPRDDPGGGRTRVGLLAPGIGAGGAEVHMLELARHVPAREVHWAGLVVMDDAGPRSPEMARALGERMPIGYGRDAALTLAGAVDLLISWAVFDVGGFLGGVSPRPRVIQILHLPASPGWRPSTAAMLAQVDQFVGVSPIALEGLPDFARERARVIGNAIDPDRIRPTRGRREMRESWGVPEDARLVGFLGRFAREKAPDAMARMMPHLPEGWHGVAIGEGPLAPSLAGVDRLRVVPVDLDAGSVMGALDVLIVPSRFETFGYSIGEALAAGLPVVARPVGLAAMHPGLARVIPPEASGREIAEAVMLAFESGPMPGSKEWARIHLDPARFGREWGELIRDVGSNPAAKLARVAACPDRGGVLPLSMQDDCGCAGRELSECRAGRGAIPGRVTLRECIACPRGA